MYKHKCLRHFNRYLPEPIQKGTEKIFVVYNNTRNYYIAFSNIMWYNGTYKIEYKPIAIELLPLDNYYLTKKYHQGYLENNPNGYFHIDFSKLNDIENEKKLGDLKYDT